jgi:hypothetical protein
MYVLNKALFVAKNQLPIRQAMQMTSARNFSSSAPSYADIPDVVKVNYTEEFEQGLTEAEKKELKRFDVYRSNPNDPDDKPKYMTYYLNTK